jgi:hypothetical protein
MAASNFDDLIAHVGHPLKCVTLGPPEGANSVAIECEKCHDVVVSFDRDDDHEKVPLLSEAMQMFFWAEVKNKETFNTMDACTLGEAQNSLDQMPTDILQEIVGTNVTRQEIEKELTALIKALGRDTELFHLMNADGA